MLSESDFIKVGQCQVSLQCMVSLADICHLKAMSERLGGLAAVQLLVDLVTAIQQGEGTELPRLPGRDTLQAMVSLGDLVQLKEMGDRLGGMPCVKAFLDLVAGLQGPPPQPTPPQRPATPAGTDTVKRVATATQGR